MLNKMNGYFEESNGDKYLTLVPTIENKEKINFFGELWLKIRDLIRTVTKKWWLWWKIQKNQIWFRW